MQLALCVVTSDTFYFNKTRRHALVELQNKLIKCFKLTASYR